MTFRRWAAVVLCGVAATASAEPDTFLLGNGQDGARTVTAWEAVPHNDRNAQVSAALSPGATTIPIASNPGLTAGDLILVWQTRGLTPDPGTNGGSPVLLTGSTAGNYELARIVSVTATSLTLSQPLWRSYAASVTQVVWVPEYTTVTISAGAGLYPAPWNGTTGGVLAFLATGTVTNNGNLESWGAGFRGGEWKADNATTGCTGLDQAAGAGAGKGEGLATGYPTASGRGYRANGAGGGVCLNSGGGGGGGATPGGIGGNAIGGAATGGLGGAEVSSLPYDRLMFGGGGGAGQMDNNGRGSGGPGAGVIFIRAASLAGAGWVAADADDGLDAANDGAGGGGGGGTVLLRLTGAASCASISALGGNGGNVTGASAPGPGGGGGGGSVYLQGSSWAACPTDQTSAVSGVNIFGQLNGAGPGVPGVSTVDATPLAHPPVPTFNAVLSPTNDSTPTFGGTVPVTNPPLQVSIFVDGVWRATVTSNSSTGAWSYTPSALANGSRTAQARTLLKGLHSPAASSTFTVDTVTPGTSLTATPAARTRSDLPPSFSFVKVEGTSTTPVSFECRVDTAAFADCTSPTAVPGLSEGSRTFQVRARDAAGNVDSSPASHTWTIDDTAPNTLLSPEPPLLTNQRVLTLTLTSTESPATLQCNLDGAGFTACTSPYSTPSLNDGDHRLEVRSTDSAGNTDATPHIATWTVDATAPVTTLETAPAAITTYPAFSFTFRSDEGGGTFECNLDGGGFSPCTSPVDVNLIDGPHTFEVRAIDPAGNPDASPEGASWTIDTTLPDTVLDAAPTGTTHQTTATFVFSSTESGVSFECSLNGAAYAACGSPHEVQNLTVASHTFRVRARDAAGNLDSSPAQATWTVQLDADGDGLEDSEELAVGTSPDRVDTDGDGLTDFAEVRGGGSNPLDGDSDDDGLLDGVEDTNRDGQHQTDETSPQNRDTDGDGLSDGLERGLGEPQGADTDLALFVADAQPGSTTDPLKVDTDGDGLEDGQEDLNRDGAKATTETDPAQADTDADGLSDGVEIRAVNPTDPLNPDCDQDQLLDGQEDTNQNGRTDPDETDPNDPDTDNGGVLDGVERQGNTNPLDGDDDYGVRGGGCAAASGGPLWGLALLALAGVGRRRSRGLLLLLGAVIGVVVPVSSRAQPSLSTAIDLQQLKPAPGAGALLGLHGAGLDPHLGWRAGFFVSYGASPLTLVVAANDQPVSEVVSGQATGDLLGAISLWNRLEVGLALPITYQLAEGLAVGGGTPSIAPAGVGDLRLVPKARLLDASGLKLALVAEVTAPTSGGGAFLGAGGFSARPRVVLDYAPLEFLRLLVNGGVNLRAPQRLLNLVVGHELTYGGAAEGTLPWAGLQISLGVAGASGLGVAAGPAQPLELLGSARLPLGRSFEVTVGGGAGLGNGYGTPSYRVLAGVSYLSGGRRVQLPMPAPPPPPSARADPDPDRDGLPSSVDGCDDKPETRNVYRDEDGCPDNLPGEGGPAPVKDQDQDGVPDEQDLCPGLAGEALEDGCPPDDDNDGIVNPLDLCPTRKEVFNGFEDDDGCPDRTPRKSRGRRR